MRIVARYLSLPEAQVAASALRAHGLHPVLMEEQLVSSQWLYLYALGGLSLSVPASEVQDAVELLRVIGADPPVPLEPEDEINLEPAFDGPTALAAALVQPLTGAGMVMAGYRVRHDTVRRVTMWLILGAWFAIWAGLVAGTVAGWWSEGS